MQTARCAATERADPQRIESVSDSGGKVIIDWGDRHQSAFHYVWLRDNCFCPECGAEYSERRVLRLLEMTLNITPATVLLNGPELQIDWSNGHTSRYDPAWLRAHCYSAAERARRQLQPVLWGKELTGRLPETTYARAAGDSGAQLEMLQLIRDFGFAIVHDVPTRPDEIEVS